MTRSRSSQAQKDLANILGIKITKDTVDVAAARLLDHVAAAIRHEPAEPSATCKGPMGECPQVIIDQQAAALITDWLIQIYAPSNTC
ncbi:hypothetical protein D3C76_292730 [compost metagenome]